MGRCTRKKGCKYAGIFPKWMLTEVQKYAYCLDCKHYKSVDVFQLRHRGKSCLSCKYYREEYSEGKCVILRCLQNDVSYNCVTDRGNFSLDLCDCYEDFPWWKYKPEPNSGLYPIAIFVLLEAVILLWHAFRGFF